MVLLQFLFLFHPIILLPSILAVIILRDQGWPGFTRDWSREHRQLSVPTSDRLGSPCRLPHSLSRSTVFLCLHVLRNDHPTTPWCRSLSCKWSEEMETGFSGPIANSWECESDGLSSAPLNRGDGRMGSTGYESRLPFFRVEVFNMLPDENTGNAFRFSTFDPCAPLPPITLRCFQVDLGFCPWY